MGQEAGELRTEIAETRDRMGDTVDALAYKADVPHRMQDAMNDKISSVKSAISGSVESVRENIGGMTGRVGDMVPDTGQCATRPCEHIMRCAKIRSAWCSERPPSDSLSGPCSQCPTWRTSGSDGSPGS